MSHLLPFTTLLPSLDELQALFNLVVPTSKAPLYVTRLAFAPLFAS